MVWIHLSQQFCCGFNPFNPRAISRGGIFSGFQQTVSFQFLETIGEVSAKSATSSTRQVMVMSSMWRFR